MKILKFIILKDLVKFPIMCLVPKILRNILHCQTSDNVVSVSALAAEWLWSSGMNTIIMYLAVGFKHEHYFNVLREWLIYPLRMFACPLSTDIDECLHNKNLCLHGVCQNAHGSFECKCENGYSVKTHLRATGCTGETYRFYLVVESKFVKQ